MSSVLRLCRKCGAEVFPDAPEGLCTACLFETGLDLFTNPPVAAGDDSVLEAGAPLPKGKSDRAKTFADFGDYELLEEVGRGGQGVVFRARQKSLNRTVALKVIGLGHWATEAHVKRFRREAEAAASLDHPGIVPIYEVGERDGSCYFSMKFVEGGQLDEIVRSATADSSGGEREPMPTRRAAELLVKITRTVQYAHERGVLHRDIKPGNILLDREGQPLLTDFGLARLAEKESTITRTIQVLGTPSYMAPEQAAGNNAQLTAATDVYGLGAVLYHVLTGSAPFAGGTTYETIKLVLESSPRRPSQLNPAVDRDLEVICLKALEKEPARRYDSAKGLADELERFLRDEPITSRPVSGTERVWRWCKRKPVVAGLAAALTLSAMIGFTGVVWELRRVQQKELNARRNLYNADMSLAHQAWAEGNVERAQALLRAHLPERRREDLRGFEWRYLWQLCRDQSRFTFRAVNFTNSEVSLEPRHLVHAGDGHTLISSSGTTLRWIDMRTRREVKRIDVGQPVRALAAAANAPGFLAYYSDKIHYLAPSGEELLGGGVPQEWCNAIALSPDGTLLASSGVSRGVTVPVQLWNVRTGEKLGKYMPPADVLGATTLLFSPDGRFLVCAETDTRLHVLEMPTLRPVKTLAGHTAWVMALAFDASGARLASGGNDSEIIVWDFASGKEISRLSGHRGRVSDVAFGGDGRTLFSGGRGDDTVRVWDLSNPGKHTILQGHRDGVKSVLSSGDGREIYSGSYDDTIKIWALPVSDAENVLHRRSALLDVKFSPDGRLITAAD